MKTKQKLMSEKSVEQMFKRFSALEPEPKTELIAPNPYCLLVAIILSAQATDVGVNRATPALFASASNPKDMVALGEAAVREKVKTIGLFRTKAKNIIAMSRKLIEWSEGRGEDQMPPRSLMEALLHASPHPNPSPPGEGVEALRDALMRLPGVGRKTANVWLNCVKGMPVMAVDTHVERVANRLGLCATKNPLATELALEKRIPKKWMQHAHHWLILHGRYICKARKPACSQCAVRQWCCYEDKEE